MERPTVIDGDVRCARCGYNLRTLRMADVCPECALGVSQSIDPDSLASAPTGWRRQLLVGVWIQFASYLLSAVAIMTEMYRSYVPGLSPALLMSLRVAPLVGIAAAVWLLTMPRPDRRIRRSTLLVRYGFAAVALLAIVLPGVEHAGFKTTFGRLGWTLFFTLLVTCWIGLGCVQVRLARTLGRRRLGWLLWTASIVWSIALMATALFYVFREFTQRSLFSRAEPIYVCALLVGGLLLVVTSLLLAVAMSASSRAAARSLPAASSPIDSI